MSKTHDTTFFVQIKKHDQSRYRNGKYISTSAVKITQDEPVRLESGCVAIKLTVRLPEEAFHPITPSAVIDVPSSLVQPQMHIIVEDPS